MDKDKIEKKEKKKNLPDKPGAKISRRSAIKKFGLFSSAVASLFLFSGQRGCRYDDWADYWDWRNYGDWVNWWNNPTS